MKKKDNLERIVPKAVALGMGVASIVLSLIKPEVNVSLFLGIGLFCLALVGMEEEK